MNWFRPNGKDICSEHMFMLLAVCIFVVNRMGLDVLGINMLYSLHINPNTDHTSYWVDDCRFYLVDASNLNSK
jgi:hypothetical protein